MEKYPNLLITPADKGNVSVILERQEYVDKVETMLSDRKTYAPVKKNPLNKIIDKEQELIKR